MNKFCHFESLPLTTSFQITPSLTLSSLTMPITGLALGSLWNTFHHVTLFSSLFRNFQCFLSSSRVKNPKLSFPHKTVHHEISEKINVSTMTAIQSFPLFFIVWKGGVWYFLMTERFCSASHPLMVSPAS